MKNKMVILLCVFAIVVVAVGFSYKEKSDETNKDFPAIGSPDYFAYRRSVAMPDPEPILGHDISLNISGKIISVSIPEIYSFKEVPVPGALYSFDINTTRPDHPPYFNNIRFDDENSRKKYVSECDADCLGERASIDPQGQLKEYLRQKQIFTEKRPARDEEMLEIKGRNWLAKNTPCEGDICYIRTYVTFVGDLRIVANIIGWPPNTFSSKTADKAFVDLKIEVK